MDISAIEEEIEDLEKTILFICSDARVNETSLYHETTDELTSNFNPSETKSEQKGKSTCTDGNISKEDKQVKSDGCDEEKSLLTGQSDDETSQADLETEMFAFTPIKCNQSCNLMSPVASRPGNNMMSLQELHSTPNPHCHSTPIVPSRKDPSKVKSDAITLDTSNSISIIEISDEKSISESSSSIIEISDDTFEKTFEELLQEVTQLCDEHTAKTGETKDMFEQDPKAAVENQISQINLEQLLCSSAKLETKEAVVFDGRSSLSVSQVADPNFFNDAIVKNNLPQDSSPGRFKGVDKSQHFYDETLVDDLADASADILGLDAFSSSDEDEDKYNDTTVITVPQSDTTLRAADESESKTEIGEATASLSGSTISASADSTVPSSHVEPLVSVVRDEETESLQDTQVAVPVPSVVAGEIEPDSNSALQQTANEAQQSGEVIPSENTDVKKDKIIQSSLVAERQNLLEETELMQFVKDKWKTTGIQRPDVNLTKCTRLHNTQKGSSSQGLLEGEERIPPLIRTVNNYTQSSTDPTALPQAKRRRIEGVDTVGQSTEDLLKSLKGQLGEINNEWERKQNFLQQQKERDEMELRHRHSVVVRSLRVRQQLELQALKQQLIYNPYLLQFRILQLHQEHVLQAQRLRDIHRVEMGSFRKEAFQKHDSEHDNFKRLYNQVHGMIKTFENKDVANVISKEPEGSYVAVDLWKGPCRSNRQTKSLVKVCLPADIASYIMREDEIYDMFYTY